MIMRIRIRAADRLRVLAVALGALASVATSRVAPRSPALAADEVTLRSGCVAYAARLDPDAAARDLFLVSRGCAAELVEVRALDWRGDPIASDAPRTIAAFDVQIAAPDGAQGAWRIPVREGRLQPPRPIAPFSVQFARPPR